MGLVLSNKCTRLYMDAIIGGIMGISELKKVADGFDVEHFMGYNRNHGINNQKIGAVEVSRWVYLTEDLKLDDLEYIAKLINIKIKNAYLKEGAKLVKKVLKGFKVKTVKNDFFEDLNYIDINHEGIKEKAEVLQGLQSEGIGQIVMWSLCLNYDQAVNLYNKKGGV